MTDDSTEVVKEQQEFTIAWGAPLGGLFPFSLSSLPAALDKARSLVEELKNTYGFESVPYSILTRRSVLTRTGWANAYGLDPDAPEEPTEAPEEVPDEL
jgi:hypothetical protein